MPRKIIALFCALALFSVNAWAKPAAYSLSEPTQTNSAIRSLFLPGWGQHFNAQRTKGYIIGGSVVATLAAAYVFNAKANETYDDYVEAGIMNGPLYSDYETQSNQATAATYLCAGIWIYAIVDAYIYGKNNDKTEAKKDSGFMVAGLGKDAGLFFVKRF